MPRMHWQTEGPTQLIKENWDQLIRTLNGVDLVPEVHVKSSDCMEELSSGSVQLVVTSPPYPYIDIWDAMLERALGLAVGSLGQDIAHFEACHLLLDAVWEECYRVLCQGGILCVNIGDATRSVGGNFRCVMNHARIVQGCERLGFISLIPILWRKPTNKPNSFLGSGFYPSNAYVTLDCEYILVFRKGNRRKFGPKDLLRKASQFSKAERDVWFSQIWDVKGARQHGFATFPNEIPYRLIRMYSVLGDTVLDPFAGTGRTLTVARELGRKPVGYEASPDVGSRLLRAVPKDGPSSERILAALLDHYARGTELLEGSVGRQNPRARPVSLDSYHERA